MRLEIRKSEQENQLAEGCRKGDRKSQKAVYERYSGRMLSLCQRYIAQQDEAEDIMINAFMKIFKKIDQYKGDGSFEGWMRRIVVNDCLSHLRKSRNMYLESSIEKLDSEPDLQLLDDNLEVEDLMRLISELPIGYRTVFNLYAIEGYSHKEVAEALNIQEATSKSQLSRARVLLQKELKRMEEQVNIKKQSYEQQ